MTEPRAGVGGLGVLARGLAMGAAEVVPGVSGGTIAFATGIYGDLVRALASFGGGSLPLLARQGWVAFARRHNIRFLALLGAGMAVGALTVGQLVKSLLDSDSHSPYVMGAFFGLVAGSIPHVGAQSGWRCLATHGVAGCAVGVALGAFAAAPDAAAPAAGAARVFLAGALAASAWLLPGLSGAFVLLLLGLYKPMLDALLGVDVAVVATFAAGLCIGLLAFSKLVGWLLKVAREPSLALLTGFMAGSLTVLWPWRQPAAADASTAGVAATMLVSALIVGGIAFAARGKTNTSAGA